MSRSSSNAKNIDTEQLFKFNPFATLSSSSTRDKIACTSTNSSVHQADVPAPSLKPFLRTNFYKYLQSQGSQHCSEESLKNQLPDELTQILDGLPGKNFAAKCVALWTLSYPSYYAKIQTVILQDDEDGFRRLMPLIQGIETYFHKHPCESSFVCYRGSKMSKSQLEAYQEGSVVCIAPFSAASKDETIARSWPSATVLIEYKIPRGSTNACDISKESEYPFEREVLLLPYTVVRVESITLSRVVVSVLNNMHQIRRAVSEHVTSRVGNVDWR